MNALFYLGAFALALGFLIVAHELGHYLVARWCGVKVLRFCIGFGKPLVSRRIGPDGTEWSLAAIPLGGYVKMLDEREGPVAAEDLPRAFNRQSVPRRFAIVAAGPLANLLLAILLYWGIFLNGVEEIRPVLGPPVSGSLAAAAGFAEGERITHVDGKEMLTWTEFRWVLLQQALQGAVVQLEVINSQREISLRRIDLGSVDTRELEGDVLQKIGLQLYHPRLDAVIGKVVEGSPGALAGLLPGDRVRRIEGKDIGSWSDMVMAIRGAAGREIALDVERSGRRVSVHVIPAAAQEQGQTVGRIGVGVEELPSAEREKLFTQVRYTPVDALGKALTQTWQTASFSLRIMGRMILGEVSWHNLSGPVTIADYAGQSARMGLIPYLKFLALISISLGVLNLLPIPILDGGHLMYYIAEVIQGRPVSERVLEIGQRIGLGLLGMLMAFAFYNDISRIFSS